MSFAVIKTGGKQYLVEPGQKLKVEKITPDAGSVITFNEVLLVVNDVDVKVGQPYVPGVSVTAIVKAQGRAKKIRVVKYHAKSRYKRTYGHRQPFTEIEITNITV